MGHLGVRWPRVYPILANIGIDCETIGITWETVGFDWDLIGISLASTGAVSFAKMAQYTGIYWELLDFFDRVNIKV